MKKLSQVPAVLRNQKHSLLWLLCILVTVPTICEASTVATPTFSPAAGTYTSIQTVTISDSTSGATIYYTTNGSTPTTSSTQYTSPITVSSSETVKAIGTKSGWTQSAVGSAAYTINLTAATPTFSPVAGTYTGAQTVTISDSTSGASIYYTTNGSTPTTSSTHYTSPIAVSASETVKAIATATGYAQSAVGSAVYTLDANTPTFSPSAGTYTSIQTVTISDSISGATIYYTTNGSTPTTSSTQYTGAITVSATETVKAIAAATGYSQSAVGSAAYTINLTAATPTFTPPAGTYTSVQTITISDSTSGSTIYYTTNGSTPTTSSTQYSSPITVGTSETVKAIATKSGYAQSSVGSAAYTINLTAATPTFSPGAGTYSSIQTVTISDSTTGSNIYYTTNGSTPSTSSTHYTAPITVSTSETVKAIATATGYAQSAVGSAAYTINLTAATPTFSPGTGSYSTIQTVTISDSMPGVTIYYTTNGSTPTAGSTAYVAPISVNATETIQAIAAGGGYASSAVGSATYTITVPAAPTPTFSPGPGTFGYSNEPEVSISDSNSSATIHYTLDGTTPTTSSNVYTGPLSIESTTTVSAIAVFPGELNSSVATALYSIQVPAPVFSLVPGSYVGTQTLTFSDNIGSRAKFYYTTNGTTPTTSSTRYTGSITISSSETIEAIATETGYTTSSASSATYTITSSIASPVFSPAPGSYPGARVVTINESSLNAAVYYTITSGATGTPPTVSSPVYTGALTISSTETLEAMAVVSGYTDSSVTTATYTIPATASTSTTLSVTSGGLPVTSVPSGSVVTLTATVLSGASPVSSGTVDFCDSSATNCTDIHLLGMSQLTSAGLAVFKFRPSVGSHSYKAVLVGSSGYLTSSSIAAQLIVAAGSGGGTATTTTINATGQPGSYTLAAVVDNTGNNTVGLTGTVSFIDTTNASAVLANATLSSTSFAFENISTPLVGMNPFYIVTGDLNGDGILDLAVVNWGDSTLTILLGNGDGTFTQASGSPIAVGEFPTSAAIGDFNGDGKPDIAVTNGDSTVSVLLGNGDGTFAQAAGSPVALPSSAYPTSLAVGDFNLDGKLDLAVGSDTFTMILLLGNGDGTFVGASQSPLTLSAGSSVVAEADFNGDGKPDLIVADQSGNVQVLMGNGDGTFNGLPSTSFSGEFSAVATGDLNQDGKADVALVGYNTGHLFIFLGNGDGTFTQATNSPLSISQNISSVGISDFNGDGKLDIVLPSWSTSVGPVLFGNGDGTFSTSPGLQIGLDYVPQSMAVGDFNGDGNPDLAIAEIGDQSDPAPVAILDYAAGEVATASVGGVSVVGSGIHNVEASYSGDTNYASSTSATTPLAAFGIAITGLSPVSGQPGTDVTISGTGFGIGAVTFNGVLASPRSWSRDTILTQVPVGATTGPVMVTTDGVSSNSLLFTVGAGISGISPATGVVGTLVTISGTGFGNAQGSSAVTFNGVPAAPSSWSNSAILVPVPAGATTGQVAVTANGVSTNGPVFTMLPSISNLSPTAGSIGAPVTITGSNFGMNQGASSILFGQVAGTPSLWTQNEIVVPVPTGAVSNPVQVVVGGQGSNTIPFAVDSSSSTGTISGTVTQSDGTTPIVGATISIFEGSNSVNTTVTNASGAYSVPNLNVNTYSVRAFAAGYALGTQSGVTVTAGQTTVENFSLAGQSPIVYTYDELGRLIGVTDPVKGTATYSYDAVGNITSIGRIAAGQVAILDFSPKSGSAGVTVTISGTGFSSNASQDSVMFNGESATVTSATANQLVVTVPAGATTGPISVTSPSGTETSSASFSVTTSATVPPFKSLDPFLAKLKAIPSLSGSEFRRSSPLHSVTLATIQTYAFGFSALSQDIRGAGRRRILMAGPSPQTDGADPSIWNIETLKGSETNQ